MTAVAPVVVWVPGMPTVRLVARATAEAALRGAALRVVSSSVAPDQWPAWRAAAGHLGVTASWEVLPSPPPSPPRARGMPYPLLLEAIRPVLVVTAPEALRGEQARALLPHVDLYVVADDHRDNRSLLREPAVVVGVPESSDGVALLAVAAHEADLRHRHLIIVHAKHEDVATGSHVAEHRWLTAAASPEGSSRTPSSARVVTTRRPVVAALRDHVDTEDVLVLGVHRPGDPGPESLDASLFEDPPCDLLLTSAGLDPGAPSLADDSRPGTLSVVPH